MSKQKPTRDSKFLQRATALQKRIKARTGTKFDVSALVRESRRSRSLNQWDADMMEARLRVATCDKCGKVMEKGEPVLILAEGSITESNDELTFQGSCVRYACHLDCWDGIEEIG